MNQIQGSNGQVQFDGHTVRIRREGLGGSASHLAPESIPVTAITAVTVHGPHSLIPGFIHFHTLGHVAPTNYVAAAKDDRTLLFKKKSADEIETLRSSLQDVIDSR